MANLSNTHTHNPEGRSGAKQRESGIAAKGTFDAPTLVWAVSGLWKQSGEEHSVCRLVDGKQGEPSKESCDIHSLHTITYIMHLT